MPYVDPISLYIITQPISSKVVKSGYGPDEIITSNCHVQAAFPPNTPDECQRMPRSAERTSTIAFTAAGDMVIYCAGFPAIYWRQPLYFEAETFAARAAIPPPKRSDSLSSLPVPEVQIV